MYQKINACIRAAIDTYEKTLPFKMWKEPILGIISAEDEGLKLLREVVSSTHLLPGDILPGAESIIVFFIPFQDSIVESNLHGETASREWALAYIKTNDLIRVINDDIAEMLRREGYAAGKLPATHNFDTERLVSDWSHRHVACIAGLGSFGFNNMLITDQGCCGRFGSMVTSLPVSAVPEAAAARPPRERCIHKLTGGCGACRKRCPVNAYGDGGFDRRRCYAQCLKNGELHKDLGYADVCGKCLAGLPCSFRSPE
ncbi:(Fe-S)-binding protein [Spirochaetia bacterium]|nr:(Fe-S)-binding protein [Spirochaetia bacterium]